MTKSTPDQLTKLRIAVAELCGWHKLTGVNVPKSTVPDYPTSHDAIEAAVREWCGNGMIRWNAYGVALAEFHNDIFIPSLRAEPYHKCLALMRAAGKEIEL